MLLIDIPHPANYDSITSAAAALPCTASDQLSPYAKQNPMAVQWTVPVGR
jgi:hypothetical protein